MIITYLNIQNFRGCRAFEISNAAQRMLLLGYNRVGKTSILDAIRAVFIGEVRDWNGARVEVGQWVGPHGKETRVTVGFTANGEDFEARMRVTKTVSLEIARQGKATITGAPKEVRTALWSMLGTTAKHRECGLSPRAYLLGDDVGQMISALGGGGVDAAALDAVLGEHRDWFRDFAAVCGVRDLNTDGLLAVGKAAFTKRTDLNARYKDAEARAQALEGVTLPTNAKGQVLKVSQIPSVEDVLQQMRQQRDGLLSELGAAQAAPTAAPVFDADAMRQELDALGLESLAQASQEAQALYAEAAKDHEKRSEALRLAESQYNGAQGAHSYADSKVREAQARIDNAPKVGDVCSSCGQEIGAKHRQSVISALYADLTKAEAEAKAAAKQAKDLLAKITTARAAAEQSKAASETARAAAAAADRALGVAEARAAALEANIGAAETALAATTTAPATRSPEAVAADLTALDSRIATATAALTTLRECRERDQAAALVDSLGAEIERLNWAIPLFCDDKKSNHASALNELSQDEQQAFLEQVNARLEPFGAQLGVQTGGKTLAVTFGAADGPQIPVAQISGAEMLLAEWAVASAFAGDGLVLLDEFNRLDGVHRPLVLEQIQESPGGLWTASAVTQAEAPDLDALNAGLAPIGVVWVGPVEAESGEAAA
jgi:hypothetical protein